MQALAKRSDKLDAIETGFLLALLFLDERNGPIRGSRANQLRFHLAARHPSRRVGCARRVAPGDRGRHRRDRCLGCGSVTRAARRTRRISAASLCQGLGALFDHARRTDHDFRRHREAERFRGLEIDGKQEVQRLFNRQIAWFGTFKDAVHVVRGAAAERQCV